MADRMKMQSPDIVSHNIEKIRKLFPSCVTEQKSADGELQFGVDFDLLKQLLGGKAEGGVALELGDGAGSLVAVGGAGFHG